MSETPPDWAIAKALDLGWRPQGYCNFDDAKSKIRCGTWPALQAFAAYIAAHEDPPVDPLLQEAIAMVEAKVDIGSFKRHPGSKIENHWAVATVLKALRRGIELGQAKS